MILYNTFYSMYILGLSYLKPYTYYLLQLETDEAMTLFYSRCVDDMELTYIPFTWRTYCCRG